MLNLNLWAVGLGWFFFTLFGLLEIVFTGPQGRNIISITCRGIWKQLYLLSVFLLNHEHISSET